MGDFYGLKKDGETLNCNDATARSSISAINEKIPSGASSSNKLVDTTAMNDAIGQAVSAAYKPAGNKTVAELTSSLLVAANRGKVYNMTDAGTTTADFVEGADHPIRVGDDIGICEPTTGTFKFNILSGFIAVDTNPTQGSANPVSSGGVYSELAGIKNGQSIDSFGDVETALADKVDKVAGKGLSTNDYNNTAKGIVDNIQSNVIANTKLIKDTVGWSGKNLLPIRESATINGITFTVNSDGTVTVNGTATARAEFVYLVESKTDYSKYAGKDVILTGCPAGGAIGTYFLGEWDSTQSNNRNDYGEGVRFTFPAEKPSDFNLKIRIENGQTVSNLVFKPMLREATILDDAYEAPHESVKDTLRDAEVIQGKNLLENKATSKTENGITWTVNSDGTVKANGTATAQTIVEVNANISFPYDVILSDDVNGDNDTYSLYAKDSDNTYYYPWSRNVIPANKTISVVNIYIRSGQTVSNLVFKPMLRLATETDPSYEPYYVPLKDSMFPRSEQAVLGAKNLCPMPFSAGYTLTTNGITFTVNDDGSYIADGTCGEGGAFLQFYRDYNNNVLQKGKTYIASSGQTANGGTQVYYRESYQSGDWVQLANAIESEKTFTVPNNANIILIRGYIGGGNTVSNKIYYPMIRLATDPDDTFVPPAMTNRELTEILTPQSGTIEAESSFTLHANTRLVKSGKVVSMGLVIYDVSVSANTWTKLATLPTGFRPRTVDAQIVGQAWCGGANMCQIQAVANGNIQINSPTALTNATVICNMTWIID